MKFFLSSETTVLKDEQAQELRESRLKVNEIMQKLVNENDYGTGVTLLTVVHNLFPEKDYEEKKHFVKRVRYFERNKEAEARLPIDFDGFFKGDMQKKQELIIENVIESISAVKEEVPEGFDAEKLIQDINNVLS